MRQRATANRDIRPLERMTRRFRHPSGHSGGVLTGDDRRLPRVLAVLALASGFCGALALTRVGLTGKAALLFLGWNLILAWVPLLVSVWIAHRHAPGRNRSRVGTF